MNYIAITLFFFFMSPGEIIFDFSIKSGSRGWQVVDDAVMGGMSGGALAIDKDGHAVFEGVVSLENNGGFSSVRYGIGTIEAGEHDRIVLMVKGDGKKYQFRVKRSRSDRHSYSYTFETTGDWQEVEIPFSQMTPTFRGYTPDIPNYPGDKIEEIGLLIGNKKAESFRLLIDRIWLE